MVKSINIVLFAYSFPHRKTIDFINRIYECGFKISLILAANYVVIKSPKSFFLIDKKTPIVSLKEEAQKKNIPIYQVDHNSLESNRLLTKYKIDFGVISGARILSRDIIMSIKYGILNFHPGLLPHIRGLDSILWAIYKDYPLGVTAHLINDHIDAGLLVYQKKLSFLQSDDLQKLYEKNYQLQLDLIPISLNLILQNQEFIELKKGEYNSRMPYKNQLELSHKIKSYIHKHAKINT